MELSPVRVAPQLCNYWRTLQHFIEPPPHPSPLFITVFTRAFCCVRRMLVRASVVPSSPIRVTLMNEALSSSETQVLTWATRRNISGDTILHSHRRGNLKSYIYPITLRSIIILSTRLSLGIPTGLIYSVSQEECVRIREDVRYVKAGRCSPKYLCPKLNGYGDNDQRKVWSSVGSMHCTCQLTNLIEVCPWVWCPVTARTSRKLHMCFLQVALQPRCNGL
jgi:hypothetical protein